MTTPCPRTPLRQALTSLRRLFNDDSYERYREAQARMAPDEPPLDRQAFKARQILMTLGRGCCGGR
ncbi:CstA-like transporter-associated (seleno)protein [Azospirillum sp. TSO35-2]|uniref:CstA-like transporter-associated (seleno)protein n=1 Tax=Azospirillum sp. TSO35-2 TaxID=716796 RepID=UPI000D61E89A|nr:CstA-like transporter-associated (seleno)protein [Azospirillum sp. TSO35-2]PWC33053.1 hypothetical protein TSO352_21125 [Azospirillum sp. TSO35-2]